MTDDSKLVLRWEIDGATAKLATGKLESGVFNAGGFKWTIAAERQAYPGVVGRGDFTLSCDVDHNRAWRCEVDIEMFLLQVNETWALRTKAHFCFDENMRTWLHKKVQAWCVLKDHKINDKVTLEFRINVISSNSGESFVDSAMFAAPNRMSNVILKIGDQKLHVSKEMLSIHSPVFETLFYGDFAEKGKEEVELKDIDYKEFLDLLHLIYLGTMKITDRTVEHILKLADRFQMKTLLAQSTAHLEQSKGFDAVKKLHLADQYNLAALKTHSLHSFTSGPELTKILKSSPDTANYSIELKAEMFDRLMKL